MARRLILILGGARSGKSAHAQRLAARLGDRVLYVATARALDGEMAARIEAHRRQRPAHWRLLEAPSEVGRALRRQPLEEPVVVVDCVSMLVANILGELEAPVSEERGWEAVRRELEELLAAIRGSQGVWILVSNEVGWGVVPPFLLGRVYRDVLGRANQRLAEAADEVVLMVAGVPLRVKPAPGAGS